MNDGSEVDRDFHRTMVGAVDFGMDLGSGHFFAELFGDHEIIDPPPGVSLAGLKTVAPPGVCVFEIRIEMPEAVKEAGR